MSTLSVEPPVKNFTSTQEDKFREELEDSDRHAIFSPVNSSREVTLDSQGKTITGGYRLTTWALFQFCQVACPGLYRFVNELAGVNRLSDQVRSDYSFDEAIEIFNNVLRRRFNSRIYGRQLIRNSKLGLIEGLVGPKYKRLSNLVLYEQARATLAQLTKPPSFYEAVLNGRWLLMRYYNPRTFVVTEGPLGERDRFLTGYHFSNNEVGEGAARAAAFLVRDMGRTVALCPSSAGGRVKHLGLTFEKRLRRILDGVLHRLQDPQFYDERIGILRQTGLGLGREDRLEEVKREDDLLHQLVRRKVSHSLSRDILDSVKVHGSYDDKKLPALSLVGVELQQRNVYDLFNALGREAKKLPINLREQVEQVAYSLLVGKFSIT